MSFKIIGYMPKEGIYHLQQCNRFKRETVTFGSSLPEHDPITDNALSSDSEQDAI